MTVGNAVKIVKTIIVCRLEIDILSNLLLFTTEVTERIDLNIKMQSETGTKKRKTTDFLITNENITREIKQNKKTTLTIKKQYTYADVMNRIKAHAHWMKLVSSDWFSMFLPYFNVKDIANLDIAFCNHADRPIWLNLLNDHIIPSVEIVNNRGLQKLTEWLI